VPALTSFLSTCLLAQITQGGSWRGRIAYLFCRFWPLITYPVTLWIQMNDHNPTKCEGLYKVPIFVTILNVRALTYLVVMIARLISSFDLCSLPFRATTYIAYILHSVDYADPPTITNHAHPQLVGAAGILILRIYAFTGGKKWVACFLGACLVTVATFQAYVAGARSARTYIILF